MSHSDSAAELSSVFVIIYYDYKNRKKRKLIIMVTVNRNVILKLLLHMQEHGHKTQNCLEGSDVNYFDIVNKEDLNQEQVECIWKECATQSGDKLIGYKLGQGLNIEALGLLGMIIQNSLTMREVISNSCKFVGLVTDLLEIKFIEKSDHSIVQIVPDKILAKLYPVRSEQICLLTLALCIKIYKIVTFRQLIPVGVRVPISFDGLERFKKLLNCPVEHNREDVYEIIVRNESLDHKVITSDYKTLALLINYANTEMGLQNAHWSKRVEKILVNNYAGSFLSLDEVAEFLNMGSRSLQRRLKDENASFIAIKDAVRLRLAKYHLDSGNSVKETAFYLGFTSISSFSKAFSKWLGINIGEYKKMSPEERKNLKIQ